VNERVADAPPFGNGASPLWCYGSRVIIRAGDEVWASVMEPVADAVPLCHLRARVLRRPEGGDWEEVWSTPGAVEREPCPLVLMPDGRIILTVNQALHPWEADAPAPRGYRTEPCLYVFAPSDRKAPPRKVVLPWDRERVFTEHSYRGVAVCPETGHLFLSWQTQVAAPGGGEEYGHAWVLLGPDLAPLAHGEFRFPMRGCYHVIALKGREVHVAAVGDEIEPNEAWRKHKFEYTGKQWDYDCRQVFYAWTPDAVKVPFSPTLTVLSRDETCGLANPLDIHRDAGGGIHLLMRVVNIGHRCVRDRFFPELPIRVSLEYVRMIRGRVVERRTLAESVERSIAETGPAPRGLSIWEQPPLVFDRPEPLGGVFQETPEGLHLLWMEAESGEARLCVRRLDPVAEQSEVVLSGLGRGYFTNTCSRAGSPPSALADLYGHDPQAREIRYLRGPVCFCATQK